MSKIKTPPVGALVILKQMQEIQKKAKDLEMEFLMKGATLSFDYGVSAEEITFWLENGRSDV